MIRFGRDTCGNVELASRKEWLETNGLGGYASGTVAGMHTRSYHAWLTAATQIPLRRMLMLSQLEEWVTYGGQKYALATNQYRGALNPQGYLNLEEFRLDPFPTWIYRLADQLLEKRIFMSHGHNLTWILYRLLTPAEGPVAMSVRPLVNFRSLHLRKRERRFFNTHHDLGEHAIRMIPDGNYPTLNLYHNAEAFEHSALWYQSLYYREEEERGLDCTEDLFSPGLLSFNLKADETSFVAATIENLSSPNPETAAEVERIRRQALLDSAPAEDEFGQLLRLAADQFLVKRDEGLSVIAGYPWMGDCGRDALVALPGLTLATRRFAEARTLLTTLAGYTQEGLLPNHFSEDDARPMYNTVDAALWFFHAAQQYLRATGDKAFVYKSLWLTLREIAEFYIRGTHCRIRMDDDGLINLPEEAAQWTWMDAQVGDWVVTPRSGKPVEVNALWYNAICFLRDVAGENGETEDHRRFADLAAKTFESFNALFWNERKGCLFDFVEDNFRDPTLRPNQLLALSLPYPLVTGERAQRVLAVVRRELFTTFGFRSLEQGNEHYVGTYQGDILRREGAAHQGTVWPWLLGPYADALLAACGPTEAVKSELRQLVLPFKAHLQERGLGSISEMFDGNPPHKARGCVARAWNVAEILRVHTLLAGL
jgi:predicted glycogen debranching enzyme